MRKYLGLLEHAKKPIALLLGLLVIVAVVWWLDGIRAVRGVFKTGNNVWIDNYAVLDELSGVVPPSGQTPPNGGLFDATKFVRVFNVPIYVEAFAPSLANFVNFCVSQHATGIKSKGRITFLARMDNGYWLRGFFNSWKPDYLRCRERENINFTKYSNIFGGGFTDVLQLYLNHRGIRTIPSEVQNFELDISPKFNARVPLGLSNRAVGQFVSASGLKETPNDQYRASKSEYGGEPRRKYLFFGGLGSPFLGVQILGLVVVGFAFACVTVLGFRRALDDANRKRRIYGWIWSIVGTIGGLFFYGWAAGGNPLTLWGWGFG